MTPDSAGGAPVADTVRGVRFDAAAVRAGDRVGSLVVERIDAHRATANSILLGSARFRGELEIGGHTMVHPGFPDVRSICVEADSAGAASMPRWSGDLRRPWFCLSNPDVAERTLARPGEVRAVRIVVADLTIHRGLSDEVNEARLVRVVERGDVERFDDRAPPP